MLTAMIIDDEPLAHDVILHHLSAHADVQVLNRFYNAAQALSWLASNKVDLMFLDINMPELSGIDLLKVLANRPQVIIVSAYQEYALQGFELDVTDYLLKPVSAERLTQALGKVRQRVQPQVSPAPTVQHIVLKVDRERRKFVIADITLLEAYGNYVKLWQGNDMTLVSSSLKQLMDKLPDSQFTQVHKSFVINNAKITAVNKDTITLENDRVIKIGKSFKQAVWQLL